MGHGTDLYPSHARAEFYCAFVLLKPLESTVDFENEGAPPKPSGSVLTVRSVSRVGEWYEDTPQGHGANLHQRKTHFFG